MALHPRVVSDAFFREALSPWTRPRHYVEVPIVARNNNNVMPAEATDYVLSLGHFGTELNAESHPEDVREGAELGLIEYIPQADGSEKTVRTHRPDLLPDGWYEQ